MCLEYWVGAHVQVCSLCMCHPAGVAALAFLTVDGSSHSSCGSLSGLPVHADVMFLDIFMPGKSGTDVMRALGGKTPIPIVAMTGIVDKDSVEVYRC